MTLTRRLLAPLVALAAVILSAGPAAASTPPNSMASMGDSITRGFNACGFYVDCPSKSYSTGDDTTVNSHYLRIKAINPAIGGYNYNDAKTGAKSVDMAGQASSAVSQRVQYVTMLIGANDACTSTEAGMTSVTTYRANIDAALSKLQSGLPNAQVYVMSVPNIYQLWQIGKSSSSARLAWATYSICQSMLANPTSTQQADVDRRARVLQRVVDYNTQLAQACAAYGANCKFDNNALFNYQFTLSLISGWDYFHPNAAGQQVLAQVTYNAGFAW
jgi:lysophospholipase L1-like esterase